MKKLSRVFVVVALALSLCFAAACEDANIPQNTLKPQTYTVTYDIGEGATGTAPVDGNKYEAGDPVKLAAATDFSREGYNFDGWHDGANKYASEYSLYIMPKHDVKFTAVWVSAGGEDDDKTPKYAVTYDIGAGATGTAPVDNNKYEAGQTVTLAPSTGFSKTGYAFDGWHDGNKTYGAGTGYTMPSDNVKFTAVWTAVGDQTPKYTVSYVLGNGVTGTAPKGGSYKAGEKINLAAATGFSRANYTFDGWHDGRGVYAAGFVGYVMPEDNVTFTAIWLPDGGAVSLLEYEGDCELPGMKDMHGDLFPSAEVVGIKVDSAEQKVYYKLDGEDGWTKSLMSYIDYSGESFMPQKYGADAFYYYTQIANIACNLLIKSDYSELWLCDYDDEPLENGRFTLVEGQGGMAIVTVTFDLGYYGYGAENPAPQKFAAGGFATEPPTPAERALFTFDGWHVGSADGPLFVFTTPVTADLTLVAKWIPKSGSYTLTFTAPQGATGTAPAAITGKSAGEQVTLPANTFTKSGWNFYYWKNKTTGSYAKNGTYTVTGNVEFVAVFHKLYSYVDTSDESYGDLRIDLLDDGYLILKSGGYDSEPMAYTQSDGLVKFNDGGYDWTVRLNDVTLRYEVVQDDDNDPSTGGGGQNPEAPTKFADYVGTYGYESAEAAGDDTVAYRTYAIYKFEMVYNANFGYRVTLYYATGTQAFTVQYLDTTAKEPSYENLPQNADNQTVYIGSGSYGRLRLNFTVDQNGKLIVNILSTDGTKTTAWSKI
ncbi:MAG: InlB B-repeat-containing protein [Clostridiales bacterium]|nr:InlB B-repeat-containing protein [Clostridiales bacterium]